MLDELAATGLIEGSDRGQNAPYCGLFHLVYTYQKPFILAATEHASAIDDNLAGAASPIFEHRSHRILGFIAISGHWWDSHQHTLGLAIISAEAISKELALKAVGKKIYAASQEVKKMNRLMQTTIDSVEEGLVHCDMQGNVLMANCRARTMLHLTEEECKEKKIFSMFPRTVTQKDIEQHASQGKEYSFDFSPRHGSAERLYGTVRSVAQDAGYILSFNRQADTHRKVAHLAYSKALFTFDSLIGNDISMKQLKERASLVAAYDSAVFIAGESGTGKEMIAQAIHSASKRVNGPFIAINCGAIPRTIMEAELFGYEKGAFTGADTKGHPGKFELANGGTLFLDGIGDMPYDVQVAMLRVLQTKEVVRVGGTRPISVDVRIISATNRDLQKKMASQQFRSDLFYRLNVFPLSMPPLRDRGDDIILLSEYFIHVYNHTYHKAVTGMSQEVASLFCAYTWPGNIRELQNTIEGAMIVCQGTLLTTQDIADFISRTRSQSEPILNSVPVSFQHTDTDEAVLLQNVLNKTKGNITKAAELLGMSRPTLYKRLKKYHIHP